MQPQRLRLVELAGLVAAFLLLAQLVRLQVVDAARFRLAASDERLRVIEVEPARGRILDRLGRVVAANVPAFGIDVVPGGLPATSAERRGVIARLEAATGVPFAELERRIEAGRRSVDPLAPVAVYDGIDRLRAIALRAELAGLPGVVVATRPLREYGGGELLGHVLGHVGPIGPTEVEGYLAAGYPLNARVGQSGLEATYEQALRGVPGRRLTLALPDGRPLSLLEELPPVPGADLVLSIDLDFQARVTEALRRGVAAGLADVEVGKWHNPDSPREAGAAVVLDVRSGEVLALASLPSFEANLLGTARDDEALARVVSDPTRPLVDRAYMEVRSPGSIFKPLVAAAALEEGVATPGTLITSRGLISIQDRYRPGVYYVFRDWAAHGTLDLYGGIARSSDVYFYYLAGGYAEGGRQLFEGLGNDRLARHARAAGLGAPTGLDLPGEASGLVPDAAWKERAVEEPWVLGDTYTFGIGQGYLSVTPLQMAVAGAALANGGEVLVPRVVSALQRDAGTTTLPREVTRRLPVDPAHLEVVREAMRLAADAGGTALGGEPRGLTIGGKTGTAEFGTMAPDGSFDTHGWFLGFAPYEEPEVVVVVYVEHGIGSSHAAPVAREIFEAYLASKPALVQR